MREVEGWMYIAWFLIIFVIVILVLYTVRPKCLLEDCECDDHRECHHCELHPLVSLWVAFSITLILVLVMWCVVNSQC